MNLALVSDLHGQKTALRNLEKIVGKYEIDGVVISGDITQYDDTAYLEEIFHLFEKTQTNAYMIWGNSDGSLAQKIILNSKYNIHLDLKIAGDQKIIGLSETDQPVVIEPKKLRGNIFVTHKPPLEKLLSRPYANAPKFHICGHLHQVERVNKYPSITTIHVPSLQGGRFALFDTTKEKVKFLGV